MELEGVTMKEWLIAWAAVLFIVISLITPTNSYATDWVKISPNEVISGAEVVVQGVYDLSGFDRKMADNRIWIPFQFRVVLYYKGSGSNYINTAIQPFDMGWVKEFQDKNGEFILFLKRDPQGLLIPVGGPNGMVQMLNGTIQNQTPTDITTYNEFLSSHALITSASSQDNNENNNKFSWYYSVLGLALILGVLLLLRWFRIKRRST